MTEPAEHAGTRGRDDLVTPGVTTHAVTDVPDAERDDPSRDVLGAPPRDAASLPGPGGPGDPDSPDVTEDAVTREARQRAPGQEFDAGEGGPAGGA